MSIKCSKSDQNGRKREKEKPIVPHIMGDMTYGQVRWSFAVLYWLPLKARRYFLGNGIIRRRIKKGRSPMGSQE